MTAAQQQNQQQQFEERGPGRSPDFMLDQTRKMLLLLGLYFSSSIVSLLAIFSSVGSVSGEIESGMLHAILAKPIRRFDVILGKFLGYSLMLAVYSALLFVSILLLNKYVAEATVPVSLYAIGLFMLQPIVLLAVSLAGSTQLSTLANGITAFMLYTIGVIGGMVEQIGALIQNSTLVKTGIASSLIMPIDSLYRMIVEAILGSASDLLSGAFYGPFGVISRPSTAMIVYTFIYLAFFLLLAMRWFTKKDIG